MIGVDARFGPVVQARDVALYGRLHVTFADVAATGGHGLPLGNPTVCGASWQDPGEARRRALGEAAERYCGHLVPVDRLMEGTWRGLGPDAVDPETLALYAKEHLERPDFPFGGLGRTDRTHWVRGARPDGVPTWVPAALVWLTPFTARRDGVARPVRLPESAGIAAGPDPDSARVAALAEVVERHALATAWMSGAEFPELVGVPLPAVPGVRLRARAVPNLLDAPVVLVVAEGEGELIGVGCAFVPGTDDPLTAAAWKAAAEALQSLDTTAQLAAGELPEWERPAGPLAGHRPDRAYRAAYRPDFADVTDVTCHLQLLADPSFAARVLARLTARPDVPERQEAARDPQAGHMTSDAIFAAGIGSSGDAPFPVEAALRAAGLTPITVDITTGDVAACGLSVVRVVVPGLRATAPGAFPLTGDGADPLPPAPYLLPVPHA